METLDGGSIDTGFWGPDISKVQLGDLPLMTTQQFVGYAALSLIDGALPKLDHAKRAEWADGARRVREKIKNIPIKQSTGKFFARSADELATLMEDVAEKDKDELFTELAASVVPTEDAEYYRENPFVVQGDGQRVGFVYQNEIQHVVDTDDLFYLLHYVIHGGMKGWDQSGTYQEVKDMAELIDSALSRDTYTPTPSASQNDA
jgi:hypothetical protein